MAPLVTGVTAAAAVGTAGPGQYAVSMDGHLMYVMDPAQAEGPKRSLVWVDRGGREEPIAAERRSYVAARVAPDGARIALDEGQGMSRNIWIWDVKHDILQRLTSELDQAEKRAPVWLPTSRSVIYSATAHDRSTVILVAADGTGAREQLLEEKRVMLIPKSMSPDGKQLLFVRWTGTLNADIAALPITGERTARTLIATPKIEDNPTISPNGRWLSYESEESGRREIYVRAFPDVDGGRWQISANGGSHPVWSRNGRELFFETPERQLAAIPVDPGEPFHYGKPTPLFDLKPGTSSASRRRRTTSRPTAASCSSRMYRHWRRPRPSWSSSTGSTKCARGWRRNDDHSRAPLTGRRSSSEKFTRTKGPRTRPAHRRETPRIVDGRC